MLTYFFTRHMHTHLAKSIPVASIYPDHIVTTIATYTVSCKPFFVPLRFRP